MLRLDASRGRLLWQARPSGAEDRIDAGLAGGVTVARGRVLVPYGYAFIATASYPEDALGGVVAYRVR